MSIHLISEQALKSARGSKTSGNHHEPPVDDSSLQTILPSSLVDNSEDVFQYQSPLELLSQVASTSVPIVQPKPLGQLKRSKGVDSGLDLLMQETPEHSMSTGESLGSDPVQINQPFTTMYAPDYDTNSLDLMAELEAMRPASPTFGLPTKMIAPTPRRGVPTSILACLSDSVSTIQSSPLPNPDTEQDGPTVIMAPTPRKPTVLPQSLRQERKEALDESSTFQSSHWLDLDLLPTIPDEIVRISSASDRIELGHSPVLRPSSAGAFLSMEPVMMPTQTELLKILKPPYRVKLLTKTGAQPAATVESAAPLLRAANTVVLGDLHGSYPKLVETLVAADMITMPRDVAETFAVLANSPVNFSTSAEELADHAGKLMALVPFMRWKGGDRRLILGGDVIGDRGPFDQVTLAVVSGLNRQKPGSLVRIGSNHDHNVLRYLIYKIDGMDNYYTRSMHGAHYIAAQQHAVEALRERYFNYLSQSELLHYEPGSKTLFAHAPVTKKHIQQLIGVMKAKQTDFNLGDVADYEAIRTPEDLTRFVGQANRFYQEYVKQAARTHKLDLAVETMLVGELVGETLANGFFWSRSPLTDEADLPFREQAIVSRLVHGHDQLSQASPFSVDEGQRGPYQIVNLDQDTRKFDSIAVLGQAALDEFCQKNTLVPKTDSRLYIE